MNLTSSIRYTNYNLMHTSHGFFKGPRDLFGVSTERCILWRLTFLSHTHDFHEELQGEESGLS